MHHYSVALLISQYACLPASVSAKFSTLQPVQSSLHLLLIALLSNAAAAVSVTDLGADGAVVGGVEARPRLRSTSRRLALHSIAVTECTRSESLGS